jgi:hypothetical protein
MLFKSGGDIYTRANIELGISRATYFIDSSTFHVNFLFCPTTILTHFFSATPSA